jgi:hypothetical protein
VDGVPQPVQPFTLSYAYYDAGRFPMQRFGVSIPPYVGTSGAGLYQVHVVVPEAPANLGGCRTGQGNLRILLSGPSSADYAEICMAARTN